MPWSATRNAGRGCPALSLPENLHLHASAADVPPDALRYRLDDGRPVAATDETDACVTIVPVR